jgi:hypothetical protein
MDYNLKLPDDDIEKIRQELFEIAEANGGPSYNAEIVGRLDILMIEANRTQVKNLTLEIMKAYVHRTALIRDLGKLLHKNEREAFNKWHDSTGRKGLESICKKCGSKKIAQVLYGLPLYDETLERKLNSGKLILGGCCVEEFNYECTDCETRYVIRPTEVFAF